MPATPAQFVGTWRLLKWIITDEAGKVTEPMGSDIQGLLVYSADGWMTAMLGHRERPRFAGNDPLGGTPGALALATDGALLTTLVDGALARLDPYIGIVALSGTGRTPQSAPPLETTVMLGDTELRIAGDGQVRIAGAPLRLPDGATPVRDLAVDGGRLWLSRPARDAALLIRRP